MKKNVLILIFLTLFVPFSLGESINSALSTNYNNDISQTSFYYYKGKRIPLYINEGKICVSVSKDCRETIERIISNIKVVDKIKDDNYDIFVILRSEYEKLSALNTWKEDTKKVILTSSYFTAEKAEVFLSPYLIVRLKNEHDINILSSYADLYGLEIVMQVPLMPSWYILSISKDSDKTSLECANKLWESGKFAASVPDLCSDIEICSNDPMFSQQWGLYNTNYSGIDISASSTWSYSTGKKIKIAVFDTGVDLNHIDLSSNISSLSFDTETNSSPSIVSHGHGTHCAGIAAAVKDNGVHIAGVAPEAIIVPISYTFKKNTFNTAKVANGIVWAYQHGADIISNSWESPIVSPIIDEAIHDAFVYGRHGKGSVVVFSAGNDTCSSVSYPANCNDTILAVGAIDKTGARAYFSNYGTKLDIVAPGDSILSTFPYNQIGYMSGTSMACAHVAGVAALILQRNSELTVAQVNSIINGNAKKIYGVSFNSVKADGTWNDEYGYGLVDAYSSVLSTPSTVYIQNDIVTGNRLFSGEKIYVGRNVTNTKADGDVIIGQGNINLQADYIEIKNSMTVPIGTTLTIEKYR